MAAFVAFREIILINLLCWVVCAEEICPRDTVPHTTKDHSKYCCKRKICQMGTYPVVCNNTTTQVTCELCPPETFMANQTPSNIEIHGCQSKKTCDPREGKITVDNGSRDEDRRCECDLEAGYYDHDSPPQAVFCVRRRCGAGQEIYINGSCITCHVGWFKEEGGYHRCRKWTDCNHIGKIMVQHGNATSGTICSDRGATTTPRVGEIRDDGEGDGPPYEMIFGIIGGVVGIVVIFGIVLYRINNCKFTRDKDAEKQSIKGREEVSSTMSSLPPPYSKTAPLSLDINKANKSISKKRHGSSPDSGIADMKGYAPYFPSSEKIGSQHNGQNFQYARDIQEDCGSTGDEHNTSFQGETIPEEDCKSVDTVESNPAVVNHYYYFPQNSNVNLQVGKDNKLYSGGAQAESPPTPDDYQYNAIDYNVPVHTVVTDPNYNTSKHTVV